MAGSIEPLPPPTPLKRALIVHMQFGKITQKLLCGACSLVDANPRPDLAPPYWCLHVSASALPKRAESGDTLKAGRVLIPIQYVAHITLGPESIHLPRRGARTSIIPPNLPPAYVPMPLAAIRAAIKELTDPARW